MLRILPLIILMTLVSACGSQEKVEPIGDSPAVLSPGSWRLTLDLEGDLLPVELVVRNESGLKVDFINAGEVITAYEYLESGDSLFITMPLFDSQFVGSYNESRTAYSGYWYNYQKGPDYRIPFNAVKQDPVRFCESNASIPPERFPLRYRVAFSPDTDDEYPAIGLFSTTPNSNRITGTFATETGDYRFLDGNFCDGALKLSCFDGSHAFLFESDYENGRLVNGVFKSGIHWKEAWEGIPDQSFELRDPDSLTQIVDSTAIWQTQLMDMEGTSYSLSELDLEHKVVIIQVLGSWCPNCVDESNSFKVFYERFHDKGLEIIPLAFERAESITEAAPILQEFRKDLDLPYPVYFAGKKGKANTAKALPALEHIMSYPTSIYIGRDGRVRKVHTGFYGPGTGIYYENWLHETEMLLEELLSES